MFYNNGYNQDWSTLKKLIWLRGNPATGQMGTDLTVSGTPPLFLPNSLGKPLKAWNVALSPYQDLHGYDNPWPAGGGKNKINYLSCVGVGARDGTDSIYDDNVSISGTELTIIQTFASNGGILKGVGTFSLATGEYVTISGKATLVDTSTLVVGIANYNGGGTSNIKMDVPVTDGKFSVTLDAKSDYAKTGIFLQPTMYNSSMVVSEVMVALGQTEQPYAPYSNLCPIIGTDKLTITTAGKNLLPFDSVLTDGWTNTESGLTATYSNGYMRVTGTNESNNWVNIVNFRLTWALNPIQCGYGDFAMPSNLVISSTADGVNANRSNPFSASRSCTVQGFYIAVQGGATVDWNIPLMFTFGTERPTEYTPYIAPSQTVIDVPPLGKNLYNMAQYPFKQFAVYNPSVAWTDPMLLQKGTYTFSCNTVFGACYIRFYATLADATANTNMIFSRQFAGGSSTTYTLDTDLYVRYQQNNTSGTQEDYDQITHAWQTELGSSATSYEPYNSTVYTGTIGSEGGESRDAMVDLGTLDWSLRTFSNKQFFTASVPNAKVYGTYDVPNWYCEAYKPVSARNFTSAMNTGDITHGVAGFYADYVCICNTDYATSEELKASLQGVKLVYELATPTTFAVPSVTIPTPTGTATTWATAEDGTVDGMEVTYVGKA